jgi:hypothetical protein
MRKITYKKNVYGITNTYDDGTFHAINLWDDGVTYRGYMRNGDFTLDRVLFRPFGKYYRVVNILDNH